MREVELFFSDLNEKGKEKLLDAAGVKEPSEMNWDIDMCPITLIHFEGEDE